MVAGWATDTPTARHPWLVGQAVRLAAAHRIGCITEADHATAGRALVARFRGLLKANPARKETPSFGRPTLVTKRDRPAFVSQTRDSSEAENANLAERLHKIEGTLAEIHALVVTGGQHSSARTATGGAAIPPA
jgi:hypothetical protein